MENVSERENCAQKHINNFSKRKGQNGQALIEYILVLIVVVGVILGGIYQLNQAFQVWADSYFGDYLACLLETGELPTLGGSSNLNECNAEYAEFSFANGRPLVNGGTSESGGGEGDGGEDESSGDEASSRRSRSGGGASAGIEGGSSGNRGIGQASRFKAGGRSAGQEGSGISRENKGGGGAGSNSIRLGGDGRAKRISLNGRSGYSRRYKDEDDSTKVSSKVSKTDASGGEKSKPQLIAVNRTVAQEAEVIEDEGMSFGGFLRYLLIAAILIALIFFFGGQLLQVSKSME